MFETLNNWMDRGLDWFDRVVGEKVRPRPTIITPEIRERLKSMRVLLVGGHPEAPLEQINKVLTDAGMQVCWERHDMHLIPKNFDLPPLRLRPDELLVNNTNLFNVVIVDWRKTPTYEWGWSPCSIFMKFGKGTLRIGIGPEDKREQQLGEGAKTFLSYDQFLVEDVEPLLVALATASIAEEEFATR